MRCFEGTKGKILRLRSGEKTNAVSETVELRTYIETFPALESRAAIFFATYRLHRACLWWRGRLLLSKPWTSDFSDSFFFGDVQMKTATTDSRWSGLKRRFLMVALLAGITGSQVGCGCECATVATLATAVAAAGPVVFVAREVQEARKTQLEIDRLEAARDSQ